MKTIVKGVHLRVSPALRRYVWEHLVEPLAQFYENSAAELEVRLVDNNGPKGGMDKECRVTARIPGHRSIHVTEVSDDVFKAVALVRDRIERATKRELSRGRNGGAHRTWRPLAQEALRLQSESPSADIS